MCCQEEDYNLCNIYFPFCVRIHSPQSHDWQIFLKPCGNFSTTYVIKQRIDLRSNPTRHDTTNVHPAVVLILKWYWTIYSLILRLVSLARTCPFSLNVVVFFFSWQTSLLNSNHFIVMFATRHRINWWTWQYPNKKYQSLWSNLISSPFKIFLQFWFSEVCFSTFIDTSNIQDKFSVDEAKPTKCNLNVWNWIWGSMISVEEASYTFTASRPTIRAANRGLGGGGKLSLSGGGEESE